MEIINKIKCNCMEFKKWLVDLFKDERNATSIKPVVAFIGTLVLCTSMIISLISKRDIEPSETLVDAVVLITCVGLGSDSLDKFSFKRQASSPPTPPPDENNLPS